MKFKTHQGPLGFSILALALLALATPLSHAWAQSSLKIGVVSLPRLLKEAPQAQASMAELQQEFAPRERSIRAKQEEFQSRSEQVQRDLAVMSEEERRAAERELRESQRDSQRLLEEFREDYNLRVNEELGKLQRSLLKEVQDYARASGYDLIVGDGVLYASDVVNITDEILRKLQANFDAGSASE
ncbi:OmpH family outer membrane protein [Lentisalinibacter sediminis]|uniref:OmpH family outer membrane protein n=1 Tax=Lentisalinibacter sediminis TaxID=2992237 RepID=UPI00386ACC2A